MTAHQEAPSLEQPKNILANCTRLNPQDGAFMRHPVIESNGSPNQPIYIDEIAVEIAGVKYENPMILPIYNGQLQLTQCAVLQQDKRVQIVPDSSVCGFAYYGELKKDKPIIICYELEAFFKLAQTYYASVLAVLPDLCKTKNKDLKQADISAIEAVIKQLSNAGYRQLYIPTRPQNKEKLIEIVRNQKAQLIDQYRNDGNFMDITQYETAEEVQLFLDSSIHELPVFKEEWNEPKPIKSELLPVKKLMPDMLPTDLNIYCHDEALRADNMTPDFIAVCLITSLGALIGSRVAIKPKQLDDYSIVPNLWGGLVAPPSSKKSPAIKAGTRHLDRLVIKANKQHEEANAEFIANDIIKKSEVKNLQRTLDGKEVISPEQQKEIALKIANLQSREDIKPTVKRYFTNDSTPEALAELERNNPNGILVIRDELVGWLSSLDQNDTDTGRAFYLEGWNGTGSYQFDRIMRGSGFIENHCLSVLGGIQPDKLMSYLDKTIKGMGNDGLLQRFQLLVYPDLLQWRYVDQAINKDAREAVYELFKSIDGLTNKELVRLGAKPKDDFNSRPYFRFTAEAQELYKTWSEHINSQTIPNEEHAIIQEHLSKFGKLMPSLALIFHLVDCVQVGSHLGGVSKNATEMAIQWCDYLESHARRIYGLVLEASSMRAGFIVNRLKRLTQDDQWRIQGFTAREIHRKEWKGLTEIDAVYRALDLLIENNWLSMQEIESTAKGGRPTKRYWINPKIY